VSRRGGGAPGMWETSRLLKSGVGLKLCLPPHCIARVSYSKTPRKRLTVRAWSHYVKMLIIVKSKLDTVTALARPREVFILTERCCALSNTSYANRSN
jgi:hypothetical protein